MQMKRFLILTFLSVMIFLTSNSQRTFFLSEEWLTSINIGATTFYGDFTDKSNRFFSNTPFSKFFYQDRQAMLSYTLEKKINIYFGVKGFISYGNIKSTKESEKAYFNAHLFEYSLNGTVDFTNLFIGYDRYRDWSIYGYVGIGFTESRTWKYSMNTGKIIGTNGFGVPKKEGGKYVPMTETVVPLGLGFRYNISKQFALNAEVSLHPIRTDKLDATISNAAKMEGYGLISVGVDYNFTLPDHWQIINRNPRYNGKSTDPAIKEFNKRKHVVMKTKAYNKASKHRHKTKRRRR